MSASDILMWKGRLSQRDIDIWFAEASFVLAPCISSWYLFRTSRMVLFQTANEVGIQLSAAVTLLVGSYYSICCC